MPASISPKFSNLRLEPFGADERRRQFSTTRYAKRKTQFIVKNEASSRLPNACGEREIPLE